MILDAHAAWYPTAGAASYSVEPNSPDADGHVAIEYNWQLRDMRTAESASDAQETPSAMPLILMPHHVPLLKTEGARVSDLGFPSVHGFCRLAVVEARSPGSSSGGSSGISWRFHLPLIPASFHAPRDIPESAKPAMLKALKQEVRSPHISPHLPASSHISPHLRLPWPSLICAISCTSQALWTPPENYIRGAGDPYNAGKFLARMGRTALIAEALGQHDLAAAVAANLTTLVHTYAISGAENEWVYDKSWGGLVSCGCDYDDCIGTCPGRCANASPPYLPWRHVACPAHPASLGATWQVRECIPNMPVARRPRPRLW